LAKEKGSRLLCWRGGGKFEDTCGKSNPSAQKENYLYKGKGGGRREKGKKIREGVRTFSLFAEGGERGGCSEDIPGGGLGGDRN